MVFLLPNRQYHCAVAVQTKNINQCSEKTVLSCWSVEPCTTSTALRSSTTHTQCTCTGRYLSQSITLYVTLQPFQLVWVLFLTHAFIHLTAQLCGLGQRILQVVMVRMFTGCVLQYLQYTVTSLSLAQPSTREHTTSVCTSTFTRHIILSRKHFHRCSFQEVKCSIVSRVQSVQTTVMKLAYWTHIYYMWHCLDHPTSALVRGHQAPLVVLQHRNLCQCRIGSAYTMSNKETR